MNSEYRINWTKYVEEISHSVSTSEPSTPSDIGHMTALKFENKSFLGIWTINYTKFISQTLVDVLSEKDELLGGEIVGHRTIELENPNSYRIFTENLKGGLSIKKEILKSLK